MTDSKTALWESKFWFIRHEIEHCIASPIFLQKCVPSAWRGHTNQTKNRRANAQGYNHLPTHLMVPTYRSNTNLFKKISLGTQIFIFCQIWVIENSTMSSKQILIGQLWTQEGANIKKITQWHRRMDQWVFKWRWCCISNIFSTAAFVGKHISWFWQSQHV